MDKKIISIYITDKKGTTQAQVGKNPLTIGTFTNVVAEFTVLSIEVDEDNMLCKIKYKEIDELETVISLVDTNYNYLISNDTDKCSNIFDIYDELKKYKKENESSEIITN